MLLHPQYFGLRHKSAKYYAELTTACDSIIAAHSFGTNEFLRISVTDQSLPKIITDLHPLRIEVGRQSAWFLLVAESHSGFGLTWDLQYGSTNIWILHETMESEDTVIYASKR
jgi:hypothetical protein